MQSIQEERELPRFAREFIGKGRELEEKRRQRRKVELEERAMANRVLFLEKEEVRAEKALLRKRQELSRIVSIAERQAIEKEEKERVLLERGRQIERAKEENRLRRLLHKQAQEHSLQTTLERNSLDYKIAKQIIESGERRKHLERLDDLTARQERHATLNLQRQHGRSRIDKYFKKKNKEHARLYQDKINSQEQIAAQKQNTIRKLSEIEEALRKQLEQSSMRVSQMDEIIGSVTKEVKNRSYSRASHRHSLSLYNTPALITTIEGELLDKEEKDEVREAEGEREGEREQAGGGGASEGGKVRRRRRNKHANRYQEYELF